MENTFYNFIQAVTNILSILVASFALLTSIRFAAMNVKPLVSVETNDYEDMKSVILVNHGLGTAVITHISISKDGTPARDNNIVTLIDPKNKIQWDDYSYFTQKQEYLRAGQQIYLAKLYDNKSSIKKQVLSQWNNRLSGIKIHICYKDVLGNKQPDYIRIFP
jgi:hypothetical protein